MENNAYNKCYNNNDNKDYDDASMEDAENTTINKL